MKHFWIILFVIIGCTSTKVEIPIVEFEAFGNQGWLGHSYRKSVEEDGFYYCYKHKTTEEVRFKTEYETILDKNK
tara:strand:- start:4183 stop:4407 length:225 start_codon:yes stop_codon:yes gene_type:complete